MSEFVGKVLQLELPQPAAAAFGAAAVGRDQEPAGVPLQRTAHAPPPPTREFHREQRGFVIGAGADSALVRCHVTDAAGYCLAELRAGKVVDADLLRVPFGRNSLLRDRGQPDPAGLTQKGPSMFE